jgi:hypothetical protein
MLCPNTGTDVLLTGPEFGMSAAEFSAFAFHGRPFVSPGGKRYRLSFTLHDGCQPYQYDPLRELPITIKAICHAARKTYPARLICPNRGKNVAATFLQP